MVKIVIVIASGGKGLIGKEHKEFSGALKLFLQCLTWITRLCAFGKTQQVVRDPCTSLYVNLTSKNKEKQLPKDKITTNLVQRS